MEKKRLENLKVLGGRTTKAVKREQAIMKEMEMTMLHLLI